MFHSDDAGGKSREDHVKDRQREENISALLTRVHLLHGWNDFAKCRAEPAKKGIRLGSADGGSQIIPKLIIEDGYLGAIHRTAMRCFKGRRNDFTSIQDLNDIRTCILMDLIFLRGCNLRRVHQIQASGAPRRLFPFRE